MHFLVFCYYLHSGACFITNHIPFLYVQTYISRPSSSIQIVIPRSVYHSVNKNCSISSYYNICSKSDFILFFFFSFLQFLRVVSYRCPWTPTFDNEWVLYVFWPLTFNVRYCIALIDCYMHHVKIKKRNKKQHYQKKIINLKMKIVIGKSKNFWSY